jgi:hypothetical protein
VLIREGIDLTLDKHEKALQRKRKNKKGDNLKGGA